MAQAAADEGSLELFQRYITYDQRRAPANSPEEFFAFCGTLGLGRLLAEGRSELLGALREQASDPRWRTREAVAMALQRLGDADMPALISEMTAWCRGNRLEQRAAVAALCEPRLLRAEQHALAVLDLLDRVTASVVDADDRKSEEFRVLRKGLGYCWSVAAAALAEEGLRRMERWLASEDPDIRWIMRENLKKARLSRIDPEWVAGAAARLDRGASP